MCVCVCVCVCVYAYMYRVPLNSEIFAFQVPVSNLVEILPSDSDLIRLNGAADGCYAERLAYEQVCKKGRKKIIKEPIFC